MSGFIKRFNAFRSNEAGTILVFWALCLTVVFGLVALSFDLGRYAITRTEYQSFADHVALAAAGELDGNSGAIARATAAAALISDRQHFGVADEVLTGGEDYTLTFYSTLPDSDLSAMTATTTSDGAAAYVRVDVTPTSVLGTFANILQPGASGAVAATATAGFDTWACDVTPLMFCLPTETLQVGDQIKLRSGGSGTAAWGPGNFGFLDPTDISVDENGPCAGYATNSAQFYACLVGAVGGFSGCFKKRGVDTETGQKEGLAAAAFNVRFDLYDGVLNNDFKDPDYAPAPNVIKGIVGKGNAACIKGQEQLAGFVKGTGQNPDSIDPVRQSIPLPRDSCFTGSTANCRAGSTRFGKGDWNRSLYISTNYGATAGAFLTALPSDATRYDFYKAEIDNPQGSGGSILPDAKDETGLPTCSQADPAGPERRLIVAAGVRDCSQIKGATKNVPVEKFYKIFLTEPVGEDGLTPATFDIYGEVVEIADGTGDQDGVGGFVRNMVQLYR